MISKPNNIFIFTEMLRLLKKWNSGKQNESASTPAQSETNNKNPDQCRKMMRSLLSNGGSPVNKHLQGCEVYQQNHSASTPAHSDTNCTTPHQHSSRQSSLLSDGMSTSSLLSDGVSTANRHLQEFELYQQNDMASQAHSGIHNTTSHQRSKTTTSLLSHGAPTANGHLQGCEMYTHNGSASKSAQSGSYNTTSHQRSTRMSSIRSLLTNDVRTANTHFQGWEPNENLVTNRELLENMAFEIDGASQFVLQEEANLEIDCNGTQLIGIQTNSVGDFKSIPPLEKHNVLYTEDKATKEMEHSMRVECDMINTSIRETMRIPPSEEVTSEDLFGFYFGQSSKIANLFMKHLGTDYVYFLKFLSTTFILQAYRLSITMLFEKSSLIDDNVIKVRMCRNLNSASIHK